MQIKQVPSQSEIITDSHTQNQLIFNFHSNSQPIWIAKIIKYIKSFNKKQMKINFEEIFSNLQTATQADKKSSHISQASTSLGFQQIIKNLRQDRIKQQLRAEQRPGLRLRKKNPNEVKRILQTYKTQKPEYYWYTESRLDEQLQYERVEKNNKKRHQKQLSFQEVNNLTNRLNQVQRCSKKQCLETCNYEIKRRVKQQMLPLNAPIKNHRRTLTEVCDYEKKHPSALHQRLYQQHKSRQFRNMQLTNEYDQMSELNNSLVRYENQQYTQNYVPFYSRLEGQIDRRTKKQQFFENNVVQDGQLLSFHPDVSKSMKTLALISKKSKIVPKKQKNPLKGRGQMNQLERLNHSRSRSIQSVMNRSVQIVKNKQQKMINKMVKLFDNKGFFQAKPDSIEQLDEQQFSIFWPLISSIQTKDKITIDQFEKELRSYLKKMPKTEKLALRKNEVQKEKKNRILIRDNQSQIQSAVTSVKNSKKSTIKNDYLNKITNFI